MSAAVVDIRLLQTVMTAENLTKALDFLQQDHMQFLGALAFWVFLFLFSCRDSTQEAARECEAKSERRLTAGSQAQQSRATLLFSACCIPLLQTIRRWRKAIPRDAWQQELSGSSLRF